MDTLIDYLAEARIAHRRNDWRASYAAFVRADGLGPMPTDDLDAFSVAAWRLGHRTEAARLAERTYDRLIRTDPAAAATKATVLALQWQARGHQALARVWADRARGLLDIGAAAGTLGYLAYLDAADALTAGDETALSQAAAVLHRSAADTADATLTVLGRVVDGITALLHARAAEGYRLLDDALEQVVDDRVSLDWAGDVYRVVLRASTRADQLHRRQWTESMRRWVVLTGVVIDTDAGPSA